MNNDNFCFYLQNRLIQTSQTRGQWYSDTSLFSIPCPSYCIWYLDERQQKRFITSAPADKNGVDIGVDEVLEIANLA
jgi:hypothetical protein